MSEYPSKEELQKVIDWKNDPMGLIEYIKQLWKYDDKGVRITGKKVIKVELHTFGWSGNEDIIEALQVNMFWFLYWQKSKRGGHYYFRFRVINS